MRIAVVGGNGQLGSDVVEAFAENEDHVCSVNHSEIEISNLDSVAASLKSLRPDVIVNTAAMHHVENCEREPEKAYAINAVGSRNLAMISQDLRATLIHISTDYVFNGQKRTPYGEEDSTLPLNVYGNSKLAGEYFVRCGVSKHFVLRTSALYGRNPCRAKGGRNFVNLMLDLARDHGNVRVVDSEIVSPTCTRELARQIVLLSRCDAYGLYHATAEGCCTWYEFAREIFRVANTKVKLEIADPNEFLPKVVRPQYSVLENRGLKRIGLNRFSTWQDGLREYLGECCLVAP